MDKLWKQVYKQASSYIGVASHCVFSIYYTNGNEPYMANLDFISGIHEPTQVSCLGKVSKLKWQSQQAVLAKQARILRNHRIVYYNRFFGLTPKIHYI